MKFVMLVDGSEENFEKMADAVDEPSLFISTEKCDEETEYRNLLDNVKRFAHSDKKIMLAKFSGRESIVKNLGGERPEMIVSLSYNKNNRHYTDRPVDMFLDLINIFKGD